MRAIVFICAITLVLSGFGVETSPAADTAGAGGILLPALTPAGTPRVGETIRFDLSFPRGAGQPYYLASSFGPGPVRVGTYPLPVAPDILFFLSVSGLAPAVFEDYAGRFDASGKATAKLHLPTHSGLVGLRIYSAYLTLAGELSTAAETSSVSQGIMFRVTP